MQVDQRGDPHLAVDTQQVTHDLPTSDRVQRGHRLIGQHHRRLLGQGPSDTHPLLLPARQVGGPYIRLFNNSDPFKSLEGRFALGGRPEPKSGPPGRDGRQAPHKHIVQYRGAVHQIERLEDHPDPRTDDPQLGGPGADHLGPVNGDRPGGGRHKAIQGPQERGLTRPRKPDDHNKLTVVDPEVHVAQCLDAAPVGHRDVVEPDHGPCVGCVVVVGFGTPISREAR